MPDFHFDALMAKLAGLAGALVSMQFLKGPWATRIALMIGGAIMAYYAGDYVAFKTGLPQGLAGFLVGFFGMAVVSKAWEWFQSAPFGEWATQAVRSVLDKWFPPRKPTDDKGA